MLTYIPAVLAVLFIGVACTLKSTPPRADRYRKDD